MKSQFAAFCLALAAFALPVASEAERPSLSAAHARALHAVTDDPPRDARHPARNQQLLIDSHGSKMNALFFLAAGAGPHPTMVVLHGLPGNERNLDLAQAVRRAGWNVLTFTYRGAWGSEGDFSITNSLEDVYTRREIDMNAVSSRKLARERGPEKAKVTRLVEALEAVPAPGETQPREPIKFPTRPGLV